MYLGLHIIYLSMPCVCRKAFLLKSAKKFRIRTMVFLCKLVFVRDNFSSNKNTLMFHHRSTSSVKEGLLTEAMMRNCPMLKFIERAGERNLLLPNGINI